MKLNFDIIYEALKREFDIERYGQAAETLHINLHSAAFQSAAQIVMKDFPTSPFIVK